MADQPTVDCELCGRDTDFFSSYIVRIDVFAEPTLPPLSTEDPEALDLDQTLAQVSEQIKGLTADDLQDSVHRRFEYRLCQACHKSFLANPMGKPRRTAPGPN